MSTTTIHDGGPAFPHDDSMSAATRPGMTLRDYFAAKAMQSSYLHFSNDDDWHTKHWTTEGLAQSAYAMADAMLKARSA